MARWKEPGADDATEPEPSGTEPREAETGAQETASSGDDGEAADSVMRPEPDPERDPEPEAETPESGEPEMPRHRGSEAPAQRRGGRGFLAGLIGGALAVGGGYGALYSLNPDILNPESTDVAGAVAPIAADVVAQAGRVASLGEDVAALRGELAAQASAPDVEALIDERLAGLEAAMAERIGALATQMETVTGAIAAFEERLLEVEKMPLLGGGEAAAGAALAYERELQQMRDALEAQRAENERIGGEVAAMADEAQARVEAAEAEAAARQAEAAAAARAALSQAALMQIRGALEGGGPFDAALADLGDADVPAALAEVAAAGVPTQADLVRSFPDAARAALDASIRASVDDGANVLERAQAFMLAQTGVRSLEPREGDDPDAVLSRAEAAVRDGRLGDALTELDALPEPGQAAMAAWRSLAESRAAALAAAAELAQSLASE